MLLDYTVSELSNKYFNKPQCATICDACGASFLLAKADTAEIIQKHLNYFHINVEPLVQMAQKYYFSQKSTANILHLPWRNNMKNCLGIRSILFIITSGIPSFYAFSSESTNKIIKTDDRRSNTVDHKSLQLNLYLDLLRYNSQEKIGILPYILKKNEGVYLEIGTGGDPISEMLSKIPPTSQVTLIASDIDENVLNALPFRHPELQRYLDAKKGPKLKLMQLDATDLRIFEDESFDGINASSLIHEIVSYAGGLNGMRNFFAHAVRTLKIGGVLVYRDPETVSDHRATVSLALKNKNIRSFAHIFFCKFLDKRGSSLASSGRKFCLYSTDDIRFKVFQKNAAVTSSLSYQDYLHVPSHDIDFSRKFVITLPCGLYREFARHYLTYLHQCNPLVYVRPTPDIFSGEYTVSYLAHSTNGIFSSFLAKNGRPMKDGRIDSIQKITLDQHIENVTRVLEFGIPLHFACKRKQCQLRALLQDHNFPPNNHIIPINDEDCLLDYRVFGLLYDELQKSIFDTNNGVMNSDEESHARWLKREGEESYFYLSTDELIAKVLEFTLMNHPKKSIGGKSYVLCPLTVDHNKFIERICYSELLKNSLELQDDLGYEMNITDGKRIIHFSKMALTDAVAICKDIVAGAPATYKKLKAYIDTLQNH